MRPRLITAVSAFALVALGGVLYFTAAAADGPQSEVLGQPPLVVAQVTPAPRDYVSAAFSEAQQTAINQMIADFIAANPDFIRDYLLSHPQVIYDAVAVLERQRIDEEANRQAGAIELHRQLILYSSRQAVLGNPDGDVTLVEFFDYNCTYCKRALSDMQRLIDEDPDLRIVLKEFPVLGLGSTEAAQVAAAVNLIAPEKYAEFHFLLLGSSAQASGELAMLAAAEVGVDEPELLSVMASDEAIATIEESYMLADALGLTGTPTYLLGDEVIVGAVGFDALQVMIASVRNCGATIC